MAERWAAVPLLLPGLIALAGLRKGTDVYTALTEGAAKGLALMGRVLPSLAVLLPAVSMLRASGALDALGRLLSPILDRVGVPAELLGLMLLRPFSGSGALALGGELMDSCGPDSPTGRMTALILGSSETTFYVLTVYFGAAGVRPSRKAALAALTADLTVYLAAVWWVRLFG